MSQPHIRPFFKKAKDIGRGCPRPCRRGADPNKVRRVPKILRSDARTLAADNFAVPLNTGIRLKRSLAPEFRISNLRRWKCKPGKLLTIGNEEQSHGPDAQEVSVGMLSSALTVVAGVANAMRYISKTEGLAGLYVGCNTTMAKAALSAGLSLALSDKIRAALKGVV